MMDIFGIGVRILNSIHENARLAIGSGRSYVLSDVVQDGDAVVFSSSECAAEFMALQETRNRAKKIKIYIVPVISGLAGLERAAWSGVKHNRVLFDHIWLEEFYAYNMAELVRRTALTASLYSKEPEL